MDFHSLSRKELQALCKQNRIPANMTNVAMADALEALLAIRGTEGVVQETLENQSAKKSAASVSAPLRFSPRVARRQAEATAPSSVAPKEHPASSLPRARRVTTGTSEIRRLFSEDEQNQTKEEVSVDSTPITGTVKYATRRTRNKEDADAKEEGSAEESRTIATRKWRRTTARRGVGTPGVEVQETEDSRKEENADASEGETVQGSKTTSMRKGRRITARRGAEAPVVGEQEKEHTVNSSKVSARRTRQSSKAIAADVTTTATRRSTRTRTRACIPVMQSLAPEAEQLQKDVDIKDPGEGDNHSVSLSCDKSLDLGTVDVDECGGKARNLDVDAKINEKQLVIVVEEDGVDALKAEEFEQLESLAHDEQLAKKDAECPKHQVAIEVEVDEIAAPTADTGAEQLEILVQEKEVADVEFKKVAQEKEEELEKGGITELAVDVEDAIATQEIEADVEELETLAQEKEELEKGDITEFAVDEEDAIVTQEVESCVEELETLAHEKEEFEKGEIVELAVGEEDAIVTQEVEAGIEELEILVQEEESGKVGIVEFAVDEENEIATQVEAGAVEFEILVKEKDEKLEKGEIVELAVNEEDAIATQDVEAGLKEWEILVNEEETEKGDIVELAVDEEDAIATQEVEASVQESEILVQEKEELEKGECKKLAIDELAEFANVKELENVPNEKVAELEKRDIDDLEISVQEENDDDDNELEKGEHNELAKDEVASPKAEQEDLAIATQQVSIRREENDGDSLFPSDMSLDLARADADDNCEQDCNLKVNDDKIPQPKLATGVKEDELAGTEAEEFAELEIVNQEEEQMEKDGKSQEGNKGHNDYPGLEEESPVLRLRSSLENLKINAREDEEMRLDLFREGTIPSETNNFSTLNQVSIDGANDKLEKAMGSPVKVTGEARDVNAISEVGNNEESLCCEANKENEIGEVNVEDDAKKQGVAINQMSLIKLKNLYKDKINMDNNKVEIRSALSEINDNKN